MYRGIFVIEAKKPCECSVAELEDFAALVLSGGEVMAAEIDERIQNAETLLFLKMKGCLKGIAAVKNPAENYKSGVFKNAQATVNPNHFQYELGWVYILPSARGAGLSRELVEAAVSTIKGQAIFATSRADNVPMHKALVRCGFSSHGQSYPSTRRNQKIMLFVRSVQHTPGDTVRQRA